MSTVKIIINSAINDWLGSIFHHQKNLDRNIEELPKLTNYLDLDVTNKAEIIKILTEHESARFEGDELVYESSISAEKFAKDKEHSKQCIRYLIDKINKVIERDDKQREQTKIYLEHLGKKVEGLAL